MGNTMDREHYLILVEEGMKGNSRMGKGLVKEHTLSMMEESM